MWKTRLPRGFTLIELIISIGMVAVLSAAVMSLIGPSSGRTARDARRMSDLNSIASALELYRNDNGTYPADGYGGLTPNYISSVPPDPLTGSGRVYDYYPTNLANGVCAGTAADRCVKYVLCAAGEKTTTLDSKCTGLACGSTCSLVVSQP